MNRRLFLFSLITAVPFAHAQTTDAKASGPFAAVRAAATKFYTELRAENIDGLPGEPQMKRLAPLLTPELVSLIEKARAFQQKQMKEHPDEKPNWIEGDLFGSLFEGVKSWTLGEAFDAPGTYGTVKVNLVYTEDGQKPVKWTDTLHFKQRDGHWLLDNIRMGGEWAFKGGATLRSQLPGGGKDGDNHTSPDEKWKVTFARDGKTLTKITIQPAKSDATAQTLFGGKGTKSTEPAWIVWSPDSDLIAVRTGRDKKHSGTQVFRLAGETWQSVKLPEFYPEEKKTMRENRFHETDSLTDAVHWQDANTLVVQYYSSYTDGSDSDGWLKHISIRIDEKGAARVIEDLDPPSEN